MHGCSQPQIELLFGGLLADDDRKSPSWSIWETCRRRSAVSLRSWTPICFVEKAVWLHRWRVRNCRTELQERETTQNSPRHSQGCWAPEKNPRMVCPGLHSQKPHTMELLSDRSSPNVRITTTGSFNGRKFTWRRLFSTSCSLRLLMPFSDSACSLRAASNLLTTAPKAYPLPLVCHKREARRQSHGDSCNFGDAKCCHVRNLFVRRCSRCPT